MKRWILMVPGVVLAIAGIVFFLQGLNVLGQTGGMNGQTIWAVLGPIIAIVGLGLVTVGVRSGRPGRSSAAAR